MHYLLEQILKTHVFILKINMLYSLIDTCTRVLNKLLDNMCSVFHRQGVNSTALPCSSSPQRVTP